MELANALQAIRSANPLLGNKGKRSTRVAPAAPAAPTAAAPTSTPLISDLAELQALLVGGNEEIANRFREHLNTYMAHLRESHLENKVKIVVVMHGLPGSGKDYLKALIVAILRSFEGLSFMEASADQLLINPEGNYEWSKEAISMAHLLSQMRVAAAVKAGINVIIVNNTHTRAQTFSPLLALMREGYVPVHIMPAVGYADTAPETTPAGFAMKLFSERNLHGVPAATMRHMSSCLQQMMIKMMPALSNKGSPRGLVPRPEYFGYLAPLSPVYLAGVFAGAHRCEIPEDLRTILTGKHVTLQFVANMVNPRDSAARQQEQREEMLRVTKQFLEWSSRGECNIADLVGRYQKDMADGRYDVLLVRLRSEGSMPVLVSPESEAPSELGYFVYRPGEALLHITLSAPEGKAATAGELASSEMRTAGPAFTRFADRVSVLLKLAPMYTNPPPGNEFGHNVASVVGQLRQDSKDLLMSGDFSAYELPELFWEDGEPFSISLLQAYFHMRVANKVRPTPIPGVFVMDVTPAVAFDDLLFENPDVRKNLRRATSFVVDTRDPVRMMQTLHRLKATLSGLFKFGYHHDLEEETLARMRGTSVEEVVLSVSMKANGDAAAVTLYTDGDFKALVVGSKKVRLLLPLGSPEELARGLAYYQNLKRQGQVMYDYALLIAETFVRQHLRGVDFVSRALEAKLMSGFTAVFEYMDPKRAHLSKIHLTEESRLLLVGLTRADDASQLGDLRFERLEDMGVETVERLTLAAITEGPGGVAVFAPSAVNGEVVEALKRLITTSSNLEELVAKVLQVLSSSALFGVERESINEGYVLEVTVGGVTMILKVKKELYVILRMMRGILNSFLKRRAYPEEEEAVDVTLERFLAKAVRALEGFRVGSLSMGRLDLSIWSRETGYLSNLWYMVRVLVMASTLPQETARLLVLAQEDDDEERAPEAAQEALALWKSMNEMELLPDAPESNLSEPALVAILKGASTRQPKNADANFEAFRTQVTTLVSQAEFTARSVVERAGPRAKNARK